MQSKSKTYLETEAEKAEQRKRQLISWAILLGVIALVVVITVIVSNLGTGGRSISVQSMPCYADQKVTVFQDGVLYYDGASIHFVNAGGGIEWSYPVGDGASYSVSETHLIAWSGRQLAIVDATGKSSFNRAMDADIQFARIGRKHAAIVTGDELASTIYVKDLQGAEIDFETNQFNGQYMLDCGFYGGSDEYMWTLSYDYYNPIVSSLLKTFQVGQMNTGTATISEHLPEKVIYVNDQLNVFTTQQMYAYDYKGVQNTDSTTLVYGWKYLDHHVPARGSANILLAPVDQTENVLNITDLRVISPNLDRRYTLPTACVGAAVENDRILAFGPVYMYSGKVDSQRFYAHAIPLPDGRQVSDFIGLTNNGYAIVASGTEIFSVTLPR
ncbi:MAG: hypothetical protein IKK21_05495 [Clostridia bacterium]|nr:hypothetical protein [Clostridia bacterium]